MIDEFLSILRTYTAFFSTISSINNKRFSARESLIVLP